MKSKTGEQNKENRALHFKVRKFRTVESNMRKFRTVESNMRKCILRCEIPKARFHTPQSKVRKFSLRAKIPCETPSWHTSGISHSPNQFSHSANQGAKISHDTVQSAKFIPTCENHSSRCEFSKRQFRTPLFKVRNTSLAHECHHFKY